MRIRTSLALAAALAAALSTLPARAYGGGPTIRVSVSTAGDQANADTPARSVPDTTSPHLALAGNVVAFSSDASDLVAGDTNGVADVFVRTMPRPQRTTRASVTADGRQANGPSYSPSMSVDGRWLAFVSSASNLVPGDRNGVADVFLKDLATGRLRRISNGLGGDEADGPSNTPFVSLFGEWVTFDSTATNLARGDGNGLRDAFIWHRASGRIERIAPPAVPDDWTTQLVAWTEHASISYDGRFVAYLATTKRARPGAPEAPDPPVTAPVHLLPEPPDQVVTADVWLHDRVRDERRKVRWPLRDGRFRHLAANPQIAADGRRVVFEAWSVVDTPSVVAFAAPREPLTVPTERSAVVEPDVLAANPVDVRNILVYDRGSGVVYSVTRNSYGFNADGDSANPQISSEGHVITFSSSATNLVPGDTNGAPDIFVADSRERVVTRISLGPNDSQADAESIRPSMTYDGRSVAFASPSSDLVARDTNARWDVFLRDRRLDYRNAAPTLFCSVPGAPYRACPTDPKEAHKRELALLTVDPGDGVTVPIRARDPDGDRLRYGIVRVLPPGQWIGTVGPLPLADPVPGKVPNGMTVHPDVGEFTWTPRPTQSGAWLIVFWVGDPRGQLDWVAQRIFVRDARQAATCVVGGC